MGEQESEGGFRVVSCADMVAKSNEVPTEADIERRYRQGYADGFVAAINLLDDMPSGVSVTQMLHFMWHAWEGEIGDWAADEGCLNDAQPPDVLIPANALRRPFRSAERRAVIDAFSARCRWCRRGGTPTADPDGVSWHIDHRLPLARGGTNQANNLVLSCRSCNSRKGTKEW